MTTSISQSRPLSFELRERTTDLHRDVERRPFQQQMAAGQVSLGAYRAWLGQMLLIHRALAEVLPDRSASNPVLARLAGFAMDKPALLRADLDSVGRPDAVVEPLTSTAALVAFMQAVAPPAGLIGVLYVLEGSTNGNRIIAARLKTTLNLGPHGLAYLDAYGPDQRKRWTEFKRLLDETVLSPDEIDAAAAAAQETFRTVGDMGDQIHAAEAPAPDAQR